MKYMKYVIAVLFVLLVILLVFAAKDYRSLRRAQLISAHQLWIASILKNHTGPLTANDVSDIRSWMTFDYINRLFRLPPTYLKTALSISDPHYPEISLSGYAKYNHVNITTLINNVSGAIRDYASSTSA